MKPENLSTHLSPEQPAVNSEPSVERVPNVDNSETTIERGADTYEQKSEANSIVADVSITTVLPTPIITDAPALDSTIIQSNPLIANDDDLIEREWVDRAKKIVAETKDDPYKRDHEVNKLQVDYIKKRFGRELGVAE